MSDEHCRTLTVNSDQLCQFVDPENGLLDKLVSMEVISFVNAQYIHCLSRYTEMVRKLIEMLIRKSDDAFDGFISALNVTGQSHVSYLLTGEGTSRPLKEEHRRRLLESPRNYMVNMTDSKSSGIITALMSKGVFSRYDEERVTSVQHSDRNEIILNLIARKSQSDFFRFISALNDTGQTHIVVALIGIHAIAKIKTNCESGDPDRIVPGVDEELVEYMREMFQRNGAVVRRLNEILSPNGVSSVRE